MASAPFQTKGDVADIAPVQLRGGFSPTKGVVGAIADVAKVAIPVVRDNLEESITDEVSGQTRSVRLALQATRFPSIQSSVFSEEALASPIVAQALAEFTQIQDATKQGILPSHFALERLEVIQNRAIKNSPEFEREIRGAMQDMVGQDPSKSLFSQLLKDSPASKTPEQKAMEQLQEDAVINGVSVDDMVGFNNSVMQATISNNKFDLAKKQGTYDAAMMGGDVRNRSSLIMLDVLSDARQLVVSGQSLTPDTIAQLKSRLAASVTAATGQLLASTNGLPIDGSVINAQLAPLQDLQNTLDDMLDDGSMQLLVGSRNKVTTELIKEGVLNMPELAASYALGGSQGFAELLAFTQKAGDSEAGRALAGALSSKAKLAFSLQSVGAGVVKQYNQIGSAEPLETTEDKQLRVIAGGVVLGTKGAEEEFQIAALNDMRKYGGDNLTWSAFEANKVLTATAASNKLKAAFINMQVSTTAGLSDELVQLSADPNVQLERISLQADGIMVVTPRPQEERVMLAQTARGADAAMGTFVTRFNRANRISAKYSGAGVLPPSRYSGIADYWDTVSEQVKALEVPPVEDTKVIIEWTRDADGNPIPVNGG